MLALSSVLPLAEMRLHCAAPPSAGATAGAIIGLTSDNTYNVRLPLDAPKNVEKWTEVQYTSPPAGNAAVPGSFTGSYMQVLPDDRSSYHDIHGEGSFTMTGLEYVIDVATPGEHTLYLRWSAGDDQGAGDSLYVVMRDYNTDHILPGKSTLKPKLEAIDAVPGKCAAASPNLNPNPNPNPDPNPNLNPNPNSNPNPNPNQVGRAHQALGCRVARAHR